MNQQNVTINGRTFEVIASTTLDDIRTDYPLTHANMLKANQRAYLSLKRPHGSKIYHAIEYTNGHITLF